MSYIYKYCNIVVFGVIAWLLLLNVGYAQDRPAYYQFPNNHLAWYTINTEKFSINYQEGNNPSAQIVAQIAENVYPELASLYKYTSQEKIHIILLDREDYSNGAAFFYDNIIEIWLPPLNSVLRGTSNWLKNVVAHELTHIMQIQTSMRGSRLRPFTYFQWLSYPNLLRPDVAFGLPNGVISYPFANLYLPAWFAEGTAQFQRLHKGYDRWDSHRDMLFRTWLMNGEIFSLREMGYFFNKNRIERELVYNVGFAFIRYLVKRYGENIVYKINKNLAHRGLFSTSRAIQQATGISGSFLYESWLDSLRQDYQTIFKNIHLTAAHPIDDDGFYNFYPQYTIDGKYMAFLSNRNRLQGGLQMHLINLQNVDFNTIDMIDGDMVHNHGMDNSPSQHYKCAFSEYNNVFNSAFSPYTFDPQGMYMIYSKAQLNKYGELYNDLYLYELEQQKTTKRITYNQRIKAPAWHPFENKVSAIKLEDGTHNIIYVNISSGEIKPITSLHHSTQLYTLAWHPNGQSLYFAMANERQRGIYKLNSIDSTIHHVLVHPTIDYRDPFISTDGKYLYHAADDDGIFNIYRLNLKNGHREKITSVKGGAFMPTFDVKNQLVYSEYTQEGYQLRTLDSSNFFSGTKLEEYHRPNGLLLAQKTNYGIKDAEVIKKHDEEPYELTQTKFSIFPIIAFHGYSKQHGSNYSLLKKGRFGKLAGNLWRDFKIGTAFTSRDILGRVRVFGQAMIAPGSYPIKDVAESVYPNTWVNMERDIYLSIDFVPKWGKTRYAPQFTAEIFHLSRNVKDGLTLDEFPCTSCLPEERSLDLTYNGLLLGLYAKSKIYPFMLATVGVQYSFSSVTVEDFISKEYNALVPKTHSDYLKAPSFFLNLDIDLSQRYKYGDIVPRGLRLFLRYGYEIGNLLDTYKLDDGVLQPIYESSYNHSLTFRWRWGGALKKWTFSMEGRIFNYFNRNLNDFYYDYIGGLFYMRGYPFFSLGGSTTAYTSTSLYIPIAHRLNFKVAQFILDNIYLRLYFDIGNAWRSSNLLTSKLGLKKSIGAELRFGMISYSFIPSQFFISATRSLDTFELQLTNDFMTPDGDDFVTYGKTTRFHFGLLFYFQFF